MLSPRKWDCPPWDGAKAEAKVLKHPKNLVVAQSGGPTPVINSSLRGIIEAAREFDAIGTVYGARHGIEGVLKEELLDLSAQSAEEVALLRFTPAAGSIGTCRYKLQAEPDRGFRSGDRRIARPPGRLSALHRRQRLDGHGQQDRPVGPRARARSGGRRRAQDDRQRRGRQRVPADRPHARLRLGGPLLDAQGPDGQRGERRLVVRPIRCW